MVSELSESREKRFLRIDPVPAPSRDSPVGEPGVSDCM